MIKHTGSLRKRITLTIITGISIILLTFSIASYYIIQKNIENSHNEKLAFARLIGNNIDNIITGQHQPAVRHIDLGQDRSARQ